MSEFQEEKTLIGVGSQPVPGPDPKRIWLRAGVPGIALWALALVVWAQRGFDE